MTAKVTDGLGKNSFRKITRRKLNCNRLKSNSGKSKYNVKLSKETTAVEGERK